MSAETLKFWRHLFGGQSGLLAVWSAERVSATAVNEDSARTRYFDYPAEAEAASAYALEEAGAGREAYFCAHLLTGRRRIKENAAPVIALWGDLDGAPLPNSGLEPTAVVESSPGRFHCYWRLSDEVPPKTAEALNKRLARKAGADPSGFDLTQLLRVPGTRNHKYPDEPVAKILRLNAGSSYSPTGLDATLPETEEPKPTEGRRSQEGEPPVRLDAAGLRVWRGEDPKLRDGQLDRSGSLMKIGRTLYDAGANRDVIERALGERDRALGWNKYTNRRDAPERYAAIVDELETNGRKAKARIPFGEEGGEGADKEEKEERRNQADRLIGYALEDAQGLFADQHGAPHALVDGEPVPLNSRCYPWLRRLMWEQEGRAVNGEYLKTAAGTLAAHAEFSGFSRELHTRAAWHEGVLYYELGPGRVVAADESGWRFEPSPPVLFRRFPNLKPLPDPELGGSLGALDWLVNLKSKRDRRLFKAYMVTVALPHVGRPILNASGAMGSGKTTVGRVLKRLWDPTAPETVRLDPRDFLQKAAHAYVLMLDNQNAIPEWGADTLCRLVTGEADSKRRLYTDDEDVIIELRRAVLLNGINVPTERGDVLDRSLVVELERIPDGERKTEEELWEGFEREHPRLLGAAFEVLSKAIGAKASLELPRRPRLADWGEYAAAVYEVLGWGAEAFLADWGHNVRLQNRTTLDGSPVALAVIGFMGDKALYRESPARLHKELEAAAEKLNLDTRRDGAWPKSSSWLWRRIKEAIPLLLAQGITAERGRGDDRTITLRKEPENADGADGEGETGLSKPESPVSTGVDADGDADGGGVDADGDARGTVSSDGPPVGKEAGADGDADGPNPLTYGECGGPVGTVSTHVDSSQTFGIREFLEDPAEWFRAQAALCVREGTPERLLNPLANAVSTHLFGSPWRWREVLPAVEEKLKEGL